MNVDHAQLGEALEWLRNELSFAIVDPSKSPGCEVRVKANQLLECTIEWSSKDAPPVTLPNDVQSRGFTVEKLTDRFHFGPNLGKEFSFYRISRNGLNLEMAARDAIELYLLVSGLSRNDWLWITNENYAERGEPERPSKWPPAGT